MKIFATFIMATAICTLSHSATLFGQLSTSEKSELDTMDAVFTMLGSLDSYINNDADEAVRAIKLQQRLFDYSDQKTRQYQNLGATSNRLDERVADRMKQKEYGLKSWASSIERFERNAESRFSSPLRMIEREIEKIRNPKKSRKPRKPNLSMIASVGNNSMKQAGSTLKILDALGKATKEQKERFETTLKELTAIENEFEMEIAKKVRMPRNSYRYQDRSQIESFVQKQWAESNQGSEIQKVLIPSTNWQGFYGARWNESEKRLEKMDVEKLDLFVLVKKSDELMRLVPVRIERKKGGSKFTVVDSPERPRSVLASNVKP